MYLVAARMSVFMSVCVHLTAGQWNQHFGGKHCRQRRSSSGLQGWTLATETQKHMLLFGK